MALVSKGQVQELLLSVASSRLADIPGAFESFAATLKSKSTAPAAMQLHLGILKLEQGLPAVASELTGDYSQLVSEAENIVDAWAQHHARAVEPLQQSTLKAKADRTTGKREEPAEFTAELLRVAWAELQDQQAFDAFAEFASAGKAPGLLAVTRASLRVLEAAAPTLRGNTELRERMRAIVREWRRHYVEPPLPDPPLLNTEPEPPLQPLSREAAQDAAIAGALRQLGYDPENPPQHTEPGLPGLRSRVKALVMPSGPNRIFASEDRFKKAWQRLRDQQKGRQKTK